MKNDAPQVEPQEWYKFDDTLICGEFDGYTDNIATISPRKSRQERTMNGDFILRACQSFHADRVTINTLTALLKLCSREMRSHIKFVQPTGVTVWHVLADRIDDTLAALEAAK